MYWVLQHFFSSNLLGFFHSSNSKQIYFSNKILQVLHPQYPLDLFHFQNINCYTWAAIFFDHSEWFVMVSSVEQQHAHSPDGPQLMHYFVVRYFLVCLSHLSLPDHILRLYFILICPWCKRALQLNKEPFERFHIEMEDLIHFCWASLLLLM